MSVQRPDFTTFSASVGIGLRLVKEAELILSTPFHTCADSVLFLKDLFGAEI